MTELKFEIQLYFKGEVSSNEEIDEIGRHILDALVYQANYQLAPQESDTVTNKIEVELPWNLGYIEKYL